MLMHAIALIIGASQPVVPVADPVLVRMTALYDQLCLHVFPDDAALDRVMAAKGATALTAEQVKRTLNDDPGRTWTIPDGDHDIKVTLELPPFHACSVRRMTARGLDDTAAYRAVVDRFKVSGDFAPTAPYDADVNGLHVHGDGEERTLPGGGTESLMIFRQHVTDPARRASGETLVNLRFVRQLHAEH